MKFLTFLQSLTIVSFIHLFNLSHPINLLHLAGYFVVSQAFMSISSPRLIENR